MNIRKPGQAENRWLSWLVYSGYRCYSHKDKPSPTDMQPSESGMQPTKHGLTEFVRALKTFSSRKINELRQTQGTPVWQRNYYEHIIRNDDEYYKTINYIRENPKNWESD